MAFITAEIKIPELYRTVPVSLYFPTDLPEVVGNQVQGVVTLLHGLGNTPSDWTWMSSAARYAADNGLVLVIPGADNSFYTDMRYGAPYYTMLTELLPAQLQAIFRLPQEREKNFICGLSMGGYGALRIGLAHPERYAAIGSFSGAVDLPFMLEAAKQVPAAAAMYAPLFGETLEVPPDGDILHLAQEVAKLPKNQQPRIYCSCGLQDELEGPILTINQRFEQAVKPLGLDIRFQYWNGVHEWNFWDRSLAEFIGFAKQSEYGTRKQADWTAKITPGT